MNKIIGLLLFLIILLFIYLFLKKKKFIFLPCICLLIFFLIYSFFTYNGAFKLATALKTGAIIESYTNKIVEPRVSTSSDSKLLNTNPLINMYGKDLMGEMECFSTTKLNIKLCRYSGYG